MPPPAPKPRARRPARSIRPPSPHARRPAPARVSHTAKRPERCPHCGSVKLVRKGTRAKKLETVQLWRCTACARVFTPSPAALRNKTYPLAIILDGITLYNLGHTLAEAAVKLKSRHGHTSVITDERSRKVAIASSFGTRPTSNFNGRLDATACWAS
jgi:transposase-like protein